MAEIIGIASGVVTLCTLLGTCLDAFDLVKEGVNQEITFRKLLVRLNIERVRLYTWGKAVGIRESTLATRSNLFEHEGVIRNSLQIITDLLLDADNIQTRYGCVPSGETAECDETSGAVAHLAAPFSHLDLTTNAKATSRGIKLLSKTRWVIRDKEKFERLVVEVKMYVDGIYSVTTPLGTNAAAERSAIEGLGRIKDVKTLEMVSVACQIDYPSFSETASNKAEALSLSSSKERDIISWVDGVSPRCTHSETVQVPTRAVEHSRCGARLAQEVGLSIKTVIQPLTDEEIQKVDEIF